MDGARVTELPDPSGTIAAARVLVLGTLRIEHADRTLHVRERRAGRRLRRALIAACLLLVVSMMAAGTALLARRQVTEQRDRANDLAGEADELAAQATEAAATAQRNAELAAERESEARAARDAETSARGDAEAERDAAQVARLVAESERATSGRLDRALLLAVEAFQRDDSTATRGALLTALTRTQPGAPPGVPFETPVASAAAGFIETGLDRVFSVSVSGDGETVAVSGSVAVAGVLADTTHQFAVFDVATGRELRRGTPDVLGVSVELDRTGSIALAWTRRAAWLLAIGDGEDVTLADGNISPILGASLSPDGTTAAVVHATGAVDFYDTRTGRRQPGPRSGAQIGGFVENGTFVYGGPDAGGVVFTNVWDPTAGAVVHSVVLEPPFGVPYPGAFRVSPDGAVLVGASEPWGLFVWDLATGALVEAEGRPKGGRAAPTFVDDRIVALGGSDGSIVLYDVARERVVRTTLETSGGGIWSLDATSDGRLLVSGADDGLVRVWQPDDRGLIDRPTAPGWWLGGSSADGSRYALWSPDGSTQIHSSGSTELPLVVAPPVADGNAFQSLRMSADGALLAQRIDWPESPTIVRAIDTSSGQIVWELPTEVEPAQALAVAPTAGGDGIYVFDGADGSVTLFGLDGAVRARLGGGAGHSDFMTPTPDGRYLDISGGTWITRLDAATLREITRVDIGFFAQGAFAHVPASDELLAAGVGGRIARVDMATGEVIVGHSADITSLYGVVLSPDGRLAVSHHAFTSSLALFDATTLRPLGRPLPAGDISGDRPAVFTPDDGLLANARFGTNRWELDPDVWLETACRVAGRNLTDGEWSELLGDEPYRATCPNWQPDVTT